MARRIIVHHQQQICLASVGTATKMLDNPQQFRSLVIVVVVMIMTAALMLRGLLLLFVVMMTNDDVSSCPRLLVFRCHHRCLSLLSSASRSTSSGLSGSSQLSFDVIAIIEVGDVVVDIIIVIVVIVVNR